VPIISTGNALLVQYFSAIGSYNGQDFTYSITYKFTKRSANATRRRQVSLEETRLISLRPVNFSALNLSETEGCDCDFADRIGSFKSWFIVLVVLGVISFVGAVLTIIALLVKCAKMRTAENKLLQTPRRSPFFKGSTD
jgi:membrane protein YqaA with SNARE-associated domain